jgi:hypothetical protein
MNKTRPFARRQNKPNSNPIYPYRRGIKPNFTNYFTSGKAYAKTTEFENITH